MVDDIAGSVDKLHKLDSTGAILLSDKVHKLDSNGAILLSVDVGTTPQFPVFDGTNIWVPNALSSTVSLIKSDRGACRNHSCHAKWQRGISLVRQHSMESVYS